MVPLLLALLSRKFLPKWVDKVKNVKDLGFYMWCFNLTILMGETVRNILHAEVSGWILALLLIVPLFVCIIQFAIGKAVGRHYDAAHPYFPQSACCRSTGCLCGLAEPGEWLATVV